MTITDYRNFDLLITRAGERYRAFVVDAPAGEDSVVFDLPFAPDAMPRLGGSGLVRGASRHLGAADDAGSAASLTDVGTRLFEAVFQDKVQTLLVASLSSVAQEGAGLRLRLRFEKDAAGLATLPWETLYDPTQGHFVGLGEQSPILRYLSLPRSRSALLVEPPLRVLAVLSSPADLPPLNMEREWQAIQDALAGLTADGKFVLERLATPSLVALQDRLLGEPVHILHFVGHGVFDEASQAGSLALEDARGRPHLVRGGQLATLLRSHLAMRLAYLNACEGALASGQSVFTGVAQTLVREGLPAAVAMQAEITDSGAIELARTFYTALAAGRPVDAALTQARVALSVADSPEWAIPVLFSRSPDNRLFDIRQVLPTPDCPYPGMTPFSEAQRDLFFGRDREIEDAVERLRQHPFLTVVGPSGSGKSSLIYAGVIPALRRSKRFGPGAWDIKIMRPGDSRTADGKAAPMQALAQLLSLLPQSPVPNPQSPVPNPQSPTLLFVDQFEETFTLAGADEAQAFLDALNGLMGRPNLHILLTVRADFYPELMACSLWQPIRANRLELTPLGDDELWAAIVEPAARVGVEVDEALAVKLIADASGQKGVLPLVQETLVLLWDKVKSRRLKLETYKEMGEDGRSGLQVAIDRRATTVYHNLPDAAQPIARRIFLRLIQFGEGRADTRRQQTVEELRASDDDPILFDQTLAKLTESRLLTASGDAEGGGRRVDIAHEALIAGWPRLQAWLDQRRAAEQIRRRLEAKAAEWVAAEKRGGLLDEYELQEAENWLAGEDARELGHSQDLVDLAQTSKAKLDQAKAEMEAQRKRELEQANRLADEQRLRAEDGVKANSGLRKRLIAATVAVAIAAIAFAAAAWFGVDASRQRNIAVANAVEAVEAAHRAQAEGLVGRTRAELAEPIPDYSLALMLAQEAISSTWEIDGYVLPNAERVLSDTIAAAPPWRMNLPPRRHDGPVTSVVFSPDGQHILTASYDGTARIWDAATGEELRRFSDAQDPIFFAAYSPDGSQVATAGNNGTCRVWEAATGRELRRLSTEDCTNHSSSGVVPLAYRPDGAQIITVGSDAVVRTWNAETGREVRSFPGEGDRNLAVAYSPDGKRIVTVSEDGFDRITHIWDAETGRKVRDLRPSGELRGSVSASYSPDGSYIITAGDDGATRLWDAATGKEVRQFKTNTTWGWPTALSPDGKFVVTLGELEIARVWNVETGQEVRQIGNLACWSDNDTQCITSAAYSRDGTQIVTGSSDGIIHVWDAATGQEIHQFGGHECRTSAGCGVNSAAYSPDSKQIVTAGDDGTARIWEAATGQEMRQLRGHAGHVSSASYSPDGRQIVTTGCDKIEDGFCKASSARIWDADTGQERRQLVSHDCGHVYLGCIFSAAYSQDGKQIVTAGADQTARIWDVATGQEVRQLLGHAGSVRSATFNPDGHQIVTTGDDGVTRIWDAATGKELRQLAGQGCGDLDVPPPLSQSRSEPPPGCGIVSAVYSRDGKQIVTAHFEGMARIWDAVTGQEVRQLRGHSAYVQTAAFSPDGKQIITTDGDGTARIWDAITGAQLRLITEPAGRILSAAYSPDGKSIVTAGCEQMAGPDNCFAATVGVWDAAPKPEVSQLDDDYAGFSSAVYSPDGQFIVTTVSRSGTVLIWNAARGEKILELPRHGCAEHNCSVNATRYSPDGKQIVTAGGDGIAHIWDAITGKEIRQLRGHTAYVQSAASSPNGGQVVTASGDGTARIWDATTEEEVGRLKGSTEGIRSVAFSPDGAYILTASMDEIARIWDATTGQEVRRLIGDGYGLRSAVYSQDGKRVVTAGDDNIARVWDAATGQEIRQLSGYRCAADPTNCTLQSAVFSPDGKYVVTAGSDTAARIWNADTGREVRSLNGHTSWVTSVAYSPDGKYIVTASEDGTARIWVADIEDLLEKAKSLISRDPPLLTSVERRYYGLE